MLSARNKHAKVKLTGAVGLLSLVLTASLFCAEFPDPRVIARISEIQAELYNDRYETARAAAESLAVNNEGNPFPLLIWSNVLITEMKEKEENLYEKRLFNLLDEADRLSMILLQSSDSTAKAWACLALGHTWANRSLWEARFGSSAQAYRKGRQAKAYYEEGLGYYPKLYDLYAGLGEYNYWKSSEAGFLRSIGLIRNERDDGIRQLQLAADSSAISRASARRGLIWVYLNQGELDSSIAIARKMHREFSDGRAFIWALAQAYFEKQEYGRALEFLYKMRQKIVAPPENYHKLISVDYLIAQCYLELGDEKQLRETGLRFLAYQNRITEPVLSDQRKKIKLLENIARPD